MTWAMHEGKVSRGPYSIVRDSRGEFCVWFRADDHYGILKRGLTTLDLAKQFSVDHAAKEAFLLKDLDAAAVKS